MIFYYFNVCFTTLIVLTACDEPELEKISGSFFWAFQEKENASNDFLSAQQPHYPEGTSTLEAQDTLKGTRYPEGTSTLKGTRYPEGTRYPPSQSYRKIDPPLVFSTNQRVFWVYEIPNTKEFATSDFKISTKLVFFANIYNMKSRNLPVRETEKRLRLYYTSSRNPIIRDTLPQLHPGIYMLQVGYRKRSIDKVEFSLVKPRSQTNEYSSDIY